MSLDAKLSAVQLNVALNLNVDLNLDVDPNSDVNLNSYITGTQEPETGTRTR